MNRIAILAVWAFDQVKLSAELLVFEVLVEVEMYLIGLVGFVFVV